MPIHNEIKGAVAWITIQRPEVLNAFDIPHLEALLAAIRAAGENDAVRALVIAGTGRAFSVGADIKSMDRMGTADFARAAALYQELARQARGLDKPVIGAINGFALGGGLEIALICDLRIAARSAKLGLPDAELGFSPTGGLTFLLGRVVGLGRALHLGMTGEVLTADKAESFGLVTQVVDDSDLLTTVGDLAARLASYPAVGMRNIKRSFHAASESGLAATLLLEQAYDSDCFGSPETRERLAAFIESRKKRK